MLQSTWQKKLNSINNRFEWHGSNWDGICEFLGLHLETATSVNPSENSNYDKNLTMTIMNISNVSLKYQLHIQW